MLFLEWKLFQHLSWTRVLFIVGTTIVTIIITEFVNKRIYQRKGNFFKFKEMWVYLFIINSLMSLIFIK